MPGRSGYPLNSALLHLFCRAVEKISALSSPTVILSILPAAFHLSLFPFAPLAS